MNSSKSIQWLVLSLWIALGFGLLLRLWRITANQFLFYDEGMYLGNNRNFLNLVAANPPKDFNELFIILNLMFHSALGTPKALWFFLLNLRVFVLGPQAWYFARLVSLVAGLATIALTYFFSYRYFKSQIIGVLSVIFLSLLPSHVFYSRLGMQESLSTLLFLAALYFYVFFKPLSWKTIICAVLLFCLFQTNYRMIIAPIFIGAIEVFEAFKNHEKINWKKMLVCSGVFAALAFFIGSLFGGINHDITFHWMFHQAQEAQGQRSLLNFFSYPYCVFTLEGVVFSLIFWSNIYLAFQKKEIQSWSKLLPFILVLLQMGIFSFAAEKGARYLCVVLPFLAMAAAVAAEYFLNSSLKKYFIVVIIVACVCMSLESLKIAQSTTNYEKAVRIIVQHDPKAKILATQFLVEQLYVPNDKDIKECPKNLADFIQLYKEGYHYLILDPQVYISWTKDTQRFSPPLIDFLEFIHSYAPPLAVLEHFNGVLLKRFVMDHNQNLLQSIKFLNLPSQEDYRQIRIYDIGQCLELLKQQALQVSQAQ